jgi:peroxiredoxin
LIVGAAVVAALLVAPLFRSASKGPAGPAGLVGQPAPVFSLRDDRGAPVSLAAYRGKIVVMNLWASWCPPCRAEMPDLERFESQYRSRGVVVIGVNQGESAQRASAFASALRIHFPIWLDSDQQYGRVFTALGLPTTVVIGRDGNVVKGFDGALTIDQMHAAVDPLAALR